MPRNFSIVLILAGLFIQFIALALLVTGRVEESFRLAPVLGLGGLMLVAGIVLAFWKRK